MSVGDQYLRHTRTILQALREFDAGAPGLAQDVIAYMVAHVPPEQIEHDVALGLLRRALGLIPGPSVSPVNREHPYYHPPASCQIGPLAGILEQQFGCRSDGFFVEAGGCDGESYSNTCFLADLGWSGAYIEPIAEYADLCRRRHADNPQVAVLEAALTAENQMLTLQIAGAATTASGDYAEVVGRDAVLAPLMTSETREVMGMRLDDILSDLAAPVPFDLLVLDVEGFEWEALCGLSLEVWRPRMVIIETSDRHEGHRAFPGLVEKSRQCRARLEGAGYRELWGDQANSIYSAG